MTQSSPLIPASAVIPLYQSNPDSSLQVLLLQRNQKLKTHGGHWVFPGGKIDPADRQSAKNDDEIATARQAAIREAREEAGLELDANCLQLHSRWITPSSLPRRFDTWFFICSLQDNTVNVDGSEICDYQWLTPTEAIAKHQSKEWVLPPPTFVTLTRLLQFTDPATAIKTMSETPLCYRPKLIPIEGGLCSLYQEDSGYEAEDPSMQEQLHRLIMIPGKFRYLAD